MVPQQRGQILHEDPLPYRIEGVATPVEFTNDSNVAPLLTNIPLP
jgi:hypothetical protein